MTQGGNEGSQGLKGPETPQISQSLLPHTVLRRRAELATCRGALTYDTLGHPQGKILRMKYHGLYPPLAPSTSAVWLQSTSSL